MTKQNLQQNQKLAEISLILYSAIKRLKDKEQSKNHLNQLDYTKNKSVHGVNINYN